MGKVPIRLNLLEVNLLKEGCAFLRRIVYCPEIAMKRDLLNAQVMYSAREYIKEKLRKCSYKTNTCNKVLKEEVRSKTTFLDPPSTIIVENIFILIVVILRSNS